MTITTSTIGAWDASSGLFVIITHLSSLHCLTCCLHLNPFLLL